MTADARFRERLRALVDRSGLSLRQASLALGRDVGYVQSLLDPSRPSRARPTPADLLAFSDATGIPFVQLLAELWEIPGDRLARECGALGLAGTSDPGLADLSEAERREVADFVAFLRSRHAPRRPTRRPRSGRA